MGKFFCHSDESCDSKPRSRGCRILHFGCHVLLGILVIIVTSAVIGWLVMTCWNYVIPTLFNLPAIDFWQAVAMLVLVRLLTGRLHHHRGGKKECCFSRKCCGKSKKAAETEEQSETSPVKE